MNNVKNQAQRKYQEKGYCRYLEALKIRGDIQRDLCDTCSGQAFLRSFS